jgi:hypothetical protein
MESSLATRRELTANPSLEPTRNGKALGPLRGVVHHPLRGPSTLPLRAAQLKLQGLPPFCKRFDLSVSFVA